MGWRLFCSELRELILTQLLALVTLLVRLLSAGGLEKVLFFLVRALFETAFFMQTVII